MGWEWVRPASTPAAPRGPAAPRQPLPMPTFDGQQIPDSALQLVEAAARLDTRSVGDLVSGWMHLPHRTRKYWSYNGALRSCQGDPSHYRCPFTLQDYLDPTNWIYAMALTIMCPSLMAQVNWSIETKGDICESIMGAHYIWSVILPRFEPRLLEQCDVKFGRRLECCSMVIEHFAWHTYQLHRETGDEGMSNWVHWIACMANSRKYHGEIKVGDVVVHEHHAELFERPRAKCDGFLTPVDTYVVD